MSSDVPLFAIAPPQPLPVVAVLPANVQLVMVIERLFVTPVVILPLQMAAPLPLLPTELPVNVLLRIVAVVDAPCALLIAPPLNDETLLRKRHDSTVRLPNDRIAPPAFD